MQKLYFKIYFLLLLFYLVFKPSHVLSQESEIYNPDIDYEGTNESYIKLDEDKTYTVALKAYTFKNGTTLYFYKKNGPVKMGQTVIDTIIKIKNYEIIVDRNSTIYFYRNGNVEGINFKTEIILPVQNNNVIFKHSNQNQFPIRDVCFYSNGDLRYGYLAKDTELTVNKQKITFIKNSIIGLYKNGLIHDGTIKDNYQITVNNKKVSLSGWLNFYENGNIKSGMLINKTLFKIGDHNFLVKKDSTIGFYDNSNIQFADVDNDINIKVGASKIYFNKNNIIRYNQKSITNHDFFSGEWEIHSGRNKITLSAGPIEFFENGVIKEAHLKHNSILKVGYYEIPFLEGVITFHDNGNIHNGLIAYDFYTKILPKITSVSNLPRQFEVEFGRDGQLIIIPL